MLTQTIKRLTTATFAGGLLAVSPLAVTAAHAAPPSGCPNYAVQTTTQTSVSISPSNPGVGQSFTATATITAGGAPVTGGTATFRYGGSAKTDTVVAGEADATFTARRGRIPLQVTYQGQCLAGSVSIGTSADRMPIVAGVSASANDSANDTANDSGNGAGIAGVSGSGGNGGVLGGLASTGLDSQTELFGLLGAGMVAVGGLTLLVHRRRVQA